MSVILAIDPGLSGAVCRLADGVLDIRRDFKELPDIARAIQALSPGVMHTVIENVHAMPGQGVCSMFSFGRAAGVADGALALCFPGIVTDSVAPQRWQNYYRAKFGIGKEQAFDSRELAIRLFPGMADIFFKRKKDHNSADAALMALWKLDQLAVAPAAQA